MTTMILDPQDVELIDMWAVRVAVREGKRMKLTTPELILAVKLCHRKNLTAPATAERLGLTRAQVDKYRRVELPIDVDSIPEDVIGRREDNETFNYKDVLRNINQRRRAMA